MQTRDQRPGVLVRLGLARAALAAALVLACAVPPAFAADQTLELEVTINGASTQKIGEFTLRDGVLLARPGELAALSLRVPRDTARTADGLVVVASLPGVSFTLDQATQAVRFTSTADRLLPLLLGPQPGPAAPATWPAGERYGRDPKLRGFQYRRRRAGFRERALRPAPVLALGRGFDRLSGLRRRSRASVRFSPRRSGWISTYVYSDFHRISAAIGSATSSPTALPGPAPSVSAAFRSAATSRCGPTL